MDFSPSRLLGHARIGFTHHPKSIILRTANGQSISLLDVCKASTPLCTLSPFLFNGNLQTMWTAMKSEEVLIHYKRHIFTATDPTYKGTFAVDFVVPPYDDTDSSLPPRTTYFTGDEFNALGSDDTKPLLITLHGLSGGSHEVYLRTVLEPLVKTGWEALVVNARGCAMSKITSSVLYNARATWDVRQVVKWCRVKWPKRQLFGIGFSLGGNILTNYLGEEGDRCLLKAAVVCSNPWNLDVSSRALARTWIGREVYLRVMGSSMRDLFELHVDEISKNPRIDVEKVRKVKYLNEFDRDVQGPTWGYPTEGAYYRDASSVDSLFSIKIPFFAIHAQDDPIAVNEAVPYSEFQQTPFAVLCTTSLGGHLSWFECGGGRWFRKPITQFLTKMAEDIEHVETVDAPDVRFANDSENNDFAPSFDPMRRKMKLHLPL